MTPEFKTRLETFTRTREEILQGAQKLWGLWNEGTYNQYYDVSDFVIEGEEIKIVATTTRHGGDTEHDSFQLDLLELAMNGHYFDLRMTRDLYRAQIAAAKTLEIKAEKEKDREQRRLTYESLKKEFESS